MQRFVSLDYAKSNAHPGWLVQYRGRGLFSPWVRLCTGGVHTHSAMMTDFNEISEVREFVGGRITDLDFQVKRFNGQMDFYSVSRFYYDPVGMENTITYMRQMAESCSYDWSNIFLLAARRVPICHLLFHDRPIDDVADFHRLRRHCSDAVSLAYQIGLADPVPRCPNRLVTPHDLTKSMMFVYEFSL